MSLASALPYILLDRQHFDRQRRGRNRVIFLFDLVGDRDLGSGRGRGGLGVGDDLDGEARVAVPATVTGSAFSPAGKPLILTVTGPSNAPLRTIFPLSSAVAPGLISSAGAASSTVAGGTTDERHGGQARRSARRPANLPLACKPTVIVPRGAATAALTVTLPSAALSAIVASAMVRPGGKGRGEIASAPSAPLVRVTLTGMVALKP